MGIPLRAACSWPATCVFCTWLFLFIAVPAFATVYYAEASGSIRIAIAQTVDGDTVIIEDGLYAETVILYGKTITIASRMLLDGDSAHLAATIITPGLSDPDTQSCVVYTYNERLDGRLYGLTLQDGRGTRETLGGHMDGGGVFVTSAVTMERCVVRSCSAHFGGGISFLDTLQGISSRGVLRHCVFTECEAAASGGGLDANHADLLVNNCWFEHNTCWNFGMAMMISSGAARIESCMVRNHLDDDITVGCIARPSVITNCVFEGNGGFGDGLSEALSIQGGDTYVTRCIFRNNIGGHAIWMHTDAIPSLPTVYGNVFEGNTTVELTGTVGVSGGNEGDIAYNLFLNNENIGGGAVYCADGTDVRIHHNWFEDNRSIDPERGSVLHVIGNTHPTLDSNVIAGNLGPAVSWYPTPPVHPWIFAMYNWWGDASGPYHPTRNPAGRGDTILQDSIEFIPWLTEPPDTTMPDALPDRERPTITSTWRLISLFPNPFNSEFTLALAGFTDTSFEVGLYNLLGAQVAELHHGPLTGGILTFSAPATLATGVYFVQLRDRTIAETRKVIFLK